jgi:hypothetical protein
VQAGKHVRQEGLRRRAAAAQHIRAIEDVGSSRLRGRKFEGEQAANFWYAQLPKSHRNAEGLTLIRGKLAEEHDRLISGEFGESVQAAIREQRALSRLANEEGDTQAAFVAVNEVTNLKRIVADIPERIADVQESLNKLDRIIAKPPR